MQPLLYGVADVGAANRGAAGDGVAAGGASVGGASAGGASVGGASAGGAAVCGASVGGASVGGAAFCGAPIGGASDGGAPSGGASVVGAPNGGASVVGATNGGASAGGASKGKSGKSVSGGGGKASQGPTQSGSASESIKALKAISDKLLDVALIHDVPTKSVVALSSEYEVLLLTLLAENERLRGRVEAMSARPAVVARLPAQATTTMLPPPAPTSGKVAPPQKKPVETWSLVVRGKKTETPKEIVSKVVKEVGPTLGVRVHEVKPIRGGGAIIRTPSLAERELVAKNAKFQEVGLDVSVSSKPGPRVVVQGVHSEISPDEFMGELFELNFKESMTPDAFKKSVRMASRPWKQGGGGTVNVTLEGAPVTALLEGRCYIKWFSFRVRPFTPVAGCFRCMSFDHRVAECRVKSDVCRRCGQVGHRAVQCPNGLNCRNCAFKGWKSDHLMMSGDCPVYGSIVARANARH